MNRVEGIPPEITHEHVRNGAFSIARTFGKPQKSKWLIASQIGEYVFTALAGVGGGHLDKKEGVLALFIGGSLAVILLVVRLTQSKAE